MLCVYAAHRQGLAANGASDKQDVLVTFRLRGILALMDDQIGHIRRAPDRA